MSAAGLMRRMPLVGVAAVVAALVLVPAARAPAPGRPAPARVQLVRFVGGGHLGGRGIFSSRPALGRGVRGFRTPSRSRGILRRIGHALAFAAILHFLFAGSSGFGFLILLLLIGLLITARRRRRASYAARW